MKDDNDTKDIAVTLETEVKGFASGLSYWAKYLAAKILSGNAITDIEINIAYSFLLEELNLIPTTTDRKSVV